MTNPRDYFANLVHETAYLNFGEVFQFVGQFLGKRTHEKRHTRHTATISVFLDDNTQRANDTLESPNVVALNRNQG